MGNLPYYLTSPLIFNLIRLRPIISRMVLMIQHEVAGRVSAPPDSDGYGVISGASDLRFFKDNTVGDDSSGAVARIRLFAAVLNRRHHRHACAQQRHARDHQQPAQVA